MDARPHGDVAMAKRKGRDIGERVFLEVWGCFRRAGGGGGDAGGGVG